jgi:hypothetical protein
LTLNYILIRYGFCEFSHLRSLTWEQFWEQKKKPLTKVKGFDCLLGHV